VGLASTVVVPLSRVTEEALSYKEPESNARIVPIYQRCHAKSAVS
jgi:hypothetical protein